MKRFYALSLLAILLLALTPLAVLAQEDPELETYTSEDELLTLEYPADWFVSVPEDIPFPSVAFVNSEEGVTRFEADEDMQSGDAAYVLLLLPADFLAFMEITLEEDTTITEIALVMVEAFMAPEEDATEEQIAAIEIGEAEEIELTDDLVAALVPVKDFDSEGSFIVYELSEGLYAIFMVSAYPGEATDEQLEAGKLIAASISFEGTAEDVLAAMFAIPDEEAPADDAADLDGEALVAERCTTCHSADRIDSAEKDEAEWTATVDRMIGYGTQLNDAEREAVIAYLAGM